MKEYNPIYSRLVKGENDIVGHVAYSLYKADKAKFFENYRKEHQGQAPDKNTISAYHEMIGEESHLARYTMQANTIVGKTLDAALIEMLEKAEKKMQENLHQHIQEAVQPLCPPAGIKRIAKEVGYAFVGALAVILTWAVLSYAVDARNRGAELRIKPDGSTQIVNTK